MRTGSSIDRESFQRLLANAFAVQESQMETQSHSAIVQIQQSIKAGDLDLDSAMHLIADRTRVVAGAAGVAIGLLRGDQLIYRAGSGTAAAYIGRRVMAALSVSAASKTSREVLRVENAQTDSRIEAAICRQFGADSLIMLLIYQGRAVAGMLQVFFSEAHRFEDPEVRSYRMMAGLVGEALSQATRTENRPVASAVPAIGPTAISPITAPQFSSHVVSLPKPAREHAIHRAYAFLMASLTRWPERLRELGADTVRDPLKRVFREPRNYAALAGIVALLVIACWVNRIERRQISPALSSGLQRSNPIEAAEPVAIIKPGVTASSKARSAFRRVSGVNEVDYISDDVTVRYFTPATPPRPVAAAYRQVDIGKDVTVRYFAPKTAAATPAPGPVTTGRHKTRL